MENKRYGQIAGDGCLRAGCRDGFFFRGGAAYRRRPAGDLEDDRPVGRSPAGAATGSLDPRPDGHRCRNFRFYERAKTAIHEADEAELEARGAGAGLTGQLRVSAATTFARLLVVPRLPEFLTRHPDLEIDIVLDDRVIDLVSEGVDLSLRMGQLSDSSAVARRLARGRRSVIATPAYLERAGTPSVPADLAAHEAIVYSQLENNWMFRKDGTEASVAIRGRVRVSAAEGIRAAVLADIGLTVNSDWMLRARSWKAAPSFAC